MYSQCPDCQTRFRVTAAALRAARGTVRCGRCGSAFDALTSLSDTLPEHVPTDSAADVAPLLAGDASTKPVRRDSTAPTEYHFSVADIEKVFVEADEWQRQYGGATGPTGDVPTRSEPQVVLVEEPGEIEDITLEGERIDLDGLEGLEEIEAAFDAETRDDLEVVDDLDSTNRFAALTDVPDSADPAEDEALAEAIESAAAEAAPARELVGNPVEAPPGPRVAAEPRPAQSAPAARDWPSGRWRPPPNAEPDPVSIPIEPRADEFADDDDGARRGSAWAWALGCLLLALSLAAQLTHHFRQDLVRHPQVGPVLRSVYDGLGLPLSPNWDPAAFELRQWGAADSEQSPGRMSVRASLTNRAAFAQPFPLLRLQLEDRFGSAVATRDFEPREYLKDPALATRMFAAGASAEARIDIVDPGSDAVGYRLDVCLRESKTLLRCAQGPG